MTWLMSNPGFFSGRRLSITMKIGAILVGLSLLYGALLFINAHLTAQLLGTNAAIDDAGTERMRTYKLAYLMRQLPEEPSAGRTRALILEEARQWESVLQGLRDGTSKYGPIGEWTPKILAQLTSIEDRWTSQLRPALEAATHGAPEDSGRPSREFARHAEGVVAALSDLLQALQQDAARRTATLHEIQLGFSLVFLAVIAGSIVFLQRVIRDPLRKLTSGAEQLAAGTSVNAIPVAATDELGQLARSFERLGERIREKIQQIEALHATGQEITMLGSGGLDQVLRRIADRAAELVGVDMAVLMVRHPIMECWVVEAASGAAFDSTRQEILLFEETPFSNEAFDTKAPVVVADLAAHADKPVRFRDEFGAKSYMAVPLLGPHGCIGVLVLMSTTATRTFTDWEISLAQQFAAYAAVTMENVQLFDAVESRSHDLQEKLRSMERQVAELTHEVVAPAGRVAEFAEWLEQDYGSRLDDKAFRYLEWIKKEGRDLAQLAGRTLDVARTLQERSPLESVDANEVVQDVLNLLAAECDAKGIRTMVAKDLPRLACRRIHVKQVFENLIGNAIKYMGHQPEPSVEIGTERDEDGAVIFVRDNGIGMDPAMIDRIFQPFQRLGTVETPGAGIGLTIVKTVVEHYGGAVAVRSSPGGGSTFSVRLPIREEGRAGSTTGKAGALAKGG